VSDFVSLNPFIAVCNVLRVDKMWSTSLVEILESIFKDTAKFDNVPPNALASACAAFDVASGILPIPAFFCVSII